MPGRDRSARQIANPYAEDLAYADSGKVVVRGLGRVGFFKDAPLLEGEPERPRIFARIAARDGDTPKKSPGARRPADDEHLIN